MRMNLLKLWTILICFYIGKSDFVGKLKVSGVYPRQNFETICLGTMDEATEKIQVMRCRRVSQKAKELNTLWFHDDEIFSHLFILDGKSWEKMNLNDGNTIVMNEFDANGFIYALLPLLLPNQGRNLPIYTDRGLVVSVSLQCISNHYGPRCRKFCDSANSEGRFTCNPHTGERICEAGWSGKDCDKKVTLGKILLPDDIKSRPKRSGCLEEPCDEEELDTRPLGTVEMDFRGAESLSCNDTCEDPGTLSCVKDEEEGTLCKCNPGFSGETCSIMDRCQLELCQHGAVCQKFENGESACICPTGYSGEFCESLIDNCIDDPCGEFGTCESDVSGFRCICDVGFEGENCEVNVDDCADDPCSGQGECYDGINSYDCECFGGYHGPNCEEKLTGCSDNPCQNGGTCASDGMDFECDCPEGYIGSTCEIEDKDPCNPDPCNEHGRCDVKLEKDYSDESYQKVAHCACNPRYEGEYCETLVSFCDVPGACPSNSTCVSRGGEFTCLCPRGYQGEFCEEPCEECQDANELLCEEDPCENGGRCIAVGEEIRCVCQNGFQGSRCGYEVDYCLEHSCGEHGLCQSTRDGYKCLCNEGFHGDRCEEDVNECERSINLCKNEAECVNLYGGYRCDCHKGYTGIFCELKIDACSQNPCRNGGSCVSHDDYSYDCDCIAGYMGYHCEQKPPCEVKRCQNGGECELRHDLEQGYQCLCEDGYHGIHCENKVTLTECKEPYCACGSTVTKGKFMNRQDKTNSACTHPRYGSGTCAVNDCISKTCENQPQLVCEYDSQCESDSQTDTSDRIRQGQYGVCARMLISFSREELPQDTTVQGICDMFRRTKPLKNILTVATKCFLHSTNNVSSVMSLSFEAELKSNARDVRRKFLKYLKNLILTNDFTEIKDDTTVMIFEAIDKVTDGSSVTGGRKFIRPTKPEAPRQTSTSKTTLIITVVCVAIFVVFALIIGVIMWMKKRKSAMTSSPVISRAENNNVPIDSVKFSKSSNGKVNPLLYANNTEVFYVKTEEAESIPPHTSALCTEATNGSNSSNSTQR